MARRPTPAEFGPLRANATNSIADGDSVAALVAELPALDQKQLCLRWRNHLTGAVRGHLSRWLLIRVLAVSALSSRVNATLKPQPPSRNALAPLCQATVSGLDDVFFI